MDREKRINASLKLLKPSAGELARCRRLLTEAVTAIAGDKDGARHEKDVASKDALKALRSYRAALYRAQNVERSLTPGMREKLALLTALELGQCPEFPALLAACDKALRVRQLPMKVDFGKFSAAVYARNVLQSIGVPAPVSRNGIWPRLAAILYGEPKADFYNHCQSAKREKPVD